ncbi:MAG: F0F1 ATP synthase subunit epsilon [bacterium]|nr:F0F1 ATP synthase subunit epsilon [bacterium]
MRLSIYTIRKTVFEGETPRVTVPTITGEITVLEHHVPYVTVLSPGNLKYVHFVPHGASTKEQEETLPINGGFLEVRAGNEIRILADE